MSERHHGPNFDSSFDSSFGLALHGHDAIDYGSNRENGGLRRRDDRAELIHLIHPEVADGEGGIRNVGWPQFPGPRSIGDVPSLRRDFRQTRAMRVVYHRGDHAIIDRDGDSHVHVIVQANPLDAPTSIEAGMPE